MSSGIKVLECTTASDIETVSVTIGGARVVISKKSFEISKIKVGVLVLFLYTDLYSFVNFAVSERNIFGKVHFCIFFGNHIVSLSSAKLHKLQSCMLVHLPTLAF